MIGYSTEVENKMDTHHMDRICDEKQWVSNILQYFAPPAGRKSKRIGELGFTTATDQRPGHPLSRKDLEKTWTPTFPNEKQRMARIAYKNSGCPGSFQDLHPNPGLDDRQHLFS
jgi:hypothetical protein